MAGAHEDRVARRDAVFGDALALQAGFQIREPDLLADVEHASFQALHVKQDAAREEGRRVLDAELLQPVWRPHVRQAVAVVEEHAGLVAARAAHAAEMAERVHLRADLADFGRDEFVVPDRPALAAIGSAGRAAGHAQGVGAPGRERHARVVGHAETDDLAGLDQADRLEHLLRVIRLPLPR